MADYVELNVEGAPTRRELIRPARDTDIVIGTIPAGYPCGGFYEVTIDPNNRIRETSKSNNSLRKFVSFRSPDGYATAPGGSLQAIPCEPYSHSEFEFIKVDIHNCCSEPTSAGDIVEVRQTGHNINRVVPHRVLVSRCESHASPREEAHIPPGECGVVYVLVEDLTRVDGALSFYFNRTWPLLTNPFTVQLNFGRWGTIIHTDTGRVERRCVYGTH